MTQCKRSVTGSAATSLTESKFFFETEYLEVKQTSSYLFTSVIFEVFNQFLKYLTEVLWPSVQIILSLFVLSSLFFFVDVSTCFEEFFFSVLVKFCSFNFLTSFKEFKWLTSVNFFSANFCE